MRKKTDPASRLDHALTLKVTAAEWEIVAREAQEAGLSASVLLHRKLVENRSVIHALPKTDQTAVIDLRYRLRLTNRVEKVLQAAALSMAGGRTSFTDYERLVFALDRIATVIQWGPEHAA